jgi:hypothetical protein
LEEITMKRCVRLFTFAFVVTCVAFCQSKAPDPGLVNSLTKQLGVTPEQATGGAGAIFSLAKNNLSAQEFGKIASVVPGMSGFLNAAPAPQADAASSAASALGPLTGGGASGGAASGLLSLGSSFKSLGLSPQMATQFAPVIQKYLSSKGGSGIASIFGKAVGL